jgi:hypothetical protein
MEILRLAKKTASLSFIRGKSLALWKSVEHDMELLFAPSKEAGACWIIIFGC